MNCQEVKELFSDYLDGRLAPSQVILLEEHANICSACAPELADLRATVSLMGSLGGIETSADFLARVNEKIDQTRNPGRLWSRLFEPIRIKLPLEAAALLLVSTLALYLYQRSPELSQKSLVGPEKNVETAQEQQREREPEQSGEATVTKPLPAPKARAERKMPLADAEVLAKLETQPPKSEAANLSGVAEKLAAAPVAGKAALDTETRRRSLEGAARPDVRERAAAALVASERQVSQTKRAEVTKAMSRGVAMLAPSAQPLEVVTEDIALSQRQLKSLVEKLGGKIVSERASENGVLLVLELPQSRQAEFQSAVKQEPGRKQREVAAFWEPAEPGSESLPPAKGSLGAAPAAVSQAKRSTQEKDEPTVKLEVRIRRKP